MVFACQGLDFAPIQHFETFAGAMSVTKAEMQAGLLLKGCGIHGIQRHQKILTI